QQSPPQCRWRGRSICRGRRRLQAATGVASLRAGRAPHGIAKISCSNSSSSTRRPKGGPMRSILRLALVAALTLTVTAASAADRIRLAVQRTGTLSWELDVLKARGLDKKADLQIEALELATPEAGKIAIKGGSADMFLSDWLYVTRERALGDALVFYPSSSTVGAV